MLISGSSDASQKLILDFLELFFTFFVLEPFDICHLRNPPFDPLDRPFSFFPTTLLFSRLTFSRTDDFTFSVALSLDVIKGPERLLCEQIRIDFIHKQVL